MQHPSKMSIGGSSPSLPVKLSWRNMTIQSIESIFVDADRTVFVSAIVEDVVQTYAQTYYDPAEYGPALCEAHFYLEEDEGLPEDEEALKDYIDKLDLEWRLVDNSDDYLD